PRPRDFRTGQFPRAAPNGSLPSDAALRHIIETGIPGTAMQPWNIPAADVSAVIQYLKTFSPRWKASR
ncbi:c-type cytochrome, partial [Shigella flexneri]|uniref:c-type cytochrome n=1 Tax=Shigella flexneri TaxID=623 RepID=UPI000A7B34D9